MRIKSAASLGAATVALMAMTACSRGATIADKDIGAAWPFTTTQVKVICAPTLAIFVTADDKAYPLNGQAERHPELYKRGPVGKLNDIWKVDPQLSKLSPDVRMSLDAFTQKAIDACAKAGKWDPTKA